MPPLRKRRDDLPLLISHFLRQLNATLGKHVTSVSPEALQSSKTTTGRETSANFKASSIRYIQSAGEVITYECLPPALRGGNVTPRNPVVAGEASRLDVADFVTRLLQAEQSEIYDKLTSAVDRVVIETVLRHAKGNQVVASELLGISRTTLRAKLRSLGLAIEKQLLPDRAWATRAGTCTSHASSPVSPGARRLRLFVPSEMFTRPGSGSLTRPLLVEFSVPSRLSNFGRSGRKLCTDSSQLEQISGNLPSGGQNFGKLVCL